MTKLKGRTVITKTTSGQVIECTVIRKSAGEYVLRSPAHGYAIVRSRKQFKLCSAPMTELRKETE
jgi:hypothetical protein